MELKDTYQKMISSDYKDRFIAEYWQTKIRYEKLKAMLTKWEAFNESEVGIDCYLGSSYHDRLRQVLGFIPTCPYTMLREQQRHMGEYLHSLELRAVLEDIDLSVTCLFSEKSQDKEKE